MLTGITRTILSSGPTPQQVPVIEGTARRRDRAVTFSNVNDYITQATRPILRKFTSSPTFQEEEGDILELTHFPPTRPALNRQKTTESMKQMEFAHLDTIKYPPSTEKNVWYMSHKERQAFKIHCDETGWLMNAQGQKLEPGIEYRYVTDKYRNFYASPASNSDHIQHSSYLAGDKASSAGKLKIIVSAKDPNKYFVLINNWSGHYKPDPKLLDQTIDILVRMGVDRKRIKKQIISDTKNM